MADYTTATWVDDDGSGTTGTLVTAARMNNIEAGVNDAAEHNQRGALASRPAASATTKNWLWTDSATGQLSYCDGATWYDVGGAAVGAAQSYSVTGVASQAIAFDPTQGPYEIVISGLHMPGGGSSKYMTLRPAGRVANIGNIRHGAFYQAGVSSSMDNPLVSGSGIYLSNTWSATQDTHTVVRGVFTPHQQSGRATFAGHRIFADASTIANVGINQIVGYIDGVSDYTAATIDFGGGTFTGTITVRPLSLVGPKGDTGGVTRAAIGSRGAASLATGQFFLDSTTGQLSYSDGSSWYDVGQPDVGDLWADGRALLHSPDANTCNLAFNYDPVADRLLDTSKPGWKLIFSSLYSTWAMQYAAATAGAPVWTNVDSNNGATGIGPAWQGDTFLAAPASTAATANLLYIKGIYVPRATRAYGLTYRTGGTLVVGNCIAALFDTAGSTRLAVSASTANAAINTNQQLAFTGQPVIPPGLYWRALLFSVAHTFQGAPSAERAGTAAQGAFTMPTSITPPAGLVSTVLPLMNIYSA